MSKTRREFTQLNKEETQHLVDYKNYSILLTKTLIISEFSLSFDRIKCRITKTLPTSSSIRISSYQNSPACVPPAENYCQIREGSKMNQKLITRYWNHFLFLIILFFMLFLADLRLIILFLAGATCWDFLAIFFFLF